MHSISHARPGSYFYSLLLIFHKTIFSWRRSNAEHSLGLIIIITSFIYPQLTYGQSQCGKIFKGDPSDFIDEAPNILPVWWDNNLGTEPVVLPGYSPVRAANNNIELSQREYKWGGKIDFILKTLGKIYLSKMQTT